MSTLEIIMTVILVALEVPAAVFLVCEWIRVNHKGKDGADGE